MRVVRGSTRTSQTPRLATACRFAHGSPRLDRRRARGSSAARAPYGHAPHSDVLEILAARPCRASRSARRTAACQCARTAAERRACRATVSARPRRHVKMASWRPGCASWRRGSGSRRVARRHRSPIISLESGRGLPSRSLASPENPAPVNRVAVPLAIIVASSRIRASMASEFAFTIPGTSTA